MPPTRVRIVSPREPLASRLGTLLASALFMCALAACDDDKETPSDSDAGTKENAASSGSKDAGKDSGKGSEEDDAGAPSTAPDASTGKSGPFLTNSLVFDTESPSSYVSVIDGLDGQTVDFDAAREFAGNADVWVWQDAIYVAVQEKLTITKFAYEQGELVEKAQLSFSDYGMTSFGFWLNTFIGPEKAYLLNAPKEYVIWNPKEMRIEGTIPLPKLEDRDGKQAGPGYSDRAAVLKGKRLFQPFYWADPSFFLFTPDSRVAVFDTETDSLVELLEVACPGIDFVTEDGSGTLYFSSWIFAPGGAAVLDQPATCVAKVDDDLKVTKAFQISDVTDGRQGGALKYIGDGKAILSVLHDDHAREAKKTDVEEIAYGAYWRFWSYDLASGKAEQIDSLDWNAGAAYYTSAADRSFVMIPTGDYKSTDTYELKPDAEPKRVLKSGGWSMRLFTVE